MLRWWVPLQGIPYQGKSEINLEGPLGFRVVRELLDVISDDVNYYDVYFDNFFTSLLLLEDLRTQGIRATGTVRANRLPGAPLPPPKEMQKKESGTIVRVDINQPYLIRKYNARMGGVDQLDGFINNLRPYIGGKK